MEAKVEGENLIIFFDSRVDTNNAAKVEKEIKNFIEKNPNKILNFDAENLEYISSVGLRILLKFRKIFKKNLVIGNVSKEVAEVFETSGFTNFFDVQKKLRRISAENLRKIGRGTSGSVYKLDDENILKVYNDDWTFEKVKIERENSRKAFLSGLDTAIAYDVVKVEKNFGIVYEMLNADTLEKVISENPEQTEFYAKKFADFLKSQNEIEFDGISGKQTRIELSKRIKNLDDETHEIIFEILEQVPECKNFSHGDLNLSNIIVQDENFIMIDMGEISCGHSIFDVSWIYYMYEIRQRYGKNVPGPKVMPEIFWKSFSQQFFNTKDEKVLKHFEAEIFPYSAINLLIATLTRAFINPKVFDYYSKVLKEIKKDRIIPIDF